MRNLLSMLLVFSFLFTIGCDDDEATDETNPLVGVYNMVSYSAQGLGQTITQEADDNNSLVFVLSEGGTYSLQGTAGYVGLPSYWIDGEPNSESGTWSIAENGALMLVHEDDEYGTITYVFSYTLSGNDMTMTIDEEGLTITYNWEKE